MKNAAFIMVSLVLLAVRCNRNEEEKLRRILPHAQTFEISAGGGDTINKTDANGFKQGQWIIFQERGQLIPVEEGLYLNNQKQGLWKYYDSTGKVTRIVNFVDGRAK